MTIDVTYGPIPRRLGTLLTATCTICGGTFRAITDDRTDATRTGVDHRCGTGVVGPLWTVIQPPARRRRIKAAA